MFFSTFNILSLS